MRQLAAVLVLLLVCGCTRRDVNRCVGDDPHPECPGVEHDAGQDLSTMDSAGSNGDIGLCEACDTDSACRAGLLCVEIDFADDVAVGSFCLWRVDASDGPDGACSNVRPFVDTLTVTSVDGEDADVCGLRSTTCPALNDYSTPCAAAGANDDCGAEAVDDAFCEAFDAATNLCTVPCASDLDCEIGFACDTSVSPRRCEL